MATKDYEVHLEMFEGPLDLLLFLIKKDDLDIQDIPIAQITKEYLSYLELMKELNLEVVGDFLVMASTLMQIKARSLLPSNDEMNEEGEIGPDPRNELVQKLMEYQRFKGAANFLSDRAEEYSNVFYRGAPRFQEKDKSLNIRIFDLLGALRDVIDRAEDDGRIVQGEEYPLEEKIEKILRLVEDNARVTVRSIFEGEKRRRAIVTCFMALLELIKLQRIFARQEHPYAEIYIYKKEEVEEPAPAIWAGAEPVASPEPALEPEETVEPEPQPRDWTGPTTVEAITERRSEILDDDQDATDETSSESDQDRLFEPSPEPELTPEPTPEPESQEDSEDQPWGPQTPPPDEDPTPREES